jgi:hypothetical protein
MIEHDAPEMTKTSTIGADITGDERTAPISTERAKAAGCESLRAIAAVLEERGIPAAR